MQFVQQKGSLSTEEKAAVANNFPITTLDRIISNPTVRQKIGIQIVDGNYYFTYPAEEEVKVLKKIVLDLATKTINVDAVKNSSQQVAYIDSLPKASMPAGPKLQSAASVASLLKVQPATPPPSIPLHVPSPLNRKTLVPKTFGLTISNGKAAQLFYELRTLNIDKFPVAGAVSLRSFVEAVVAIYCDSHSISMVHTSGKNAGKALSLAEKVDAVLTHLTPIMTKQEITAARASLTGNTSVISIARLNEYVHNPAMFPSKNDLVAAWSGVEAFFKAASK